MKTSLIALALAAALAGCAGTPSTTGVTGALSAPVTLGTQSPEAQMKLGADTVTELNVLATKLLANHVITVTQAKGYRNMLVAANESLKDANADLLACRVTTPAPATGTDPCWLKVSDVASLALANIAGIQKTLKAK